MVKKYDVPPTTGYDPAENGFKLGTLEEVQYRLQNARKWSHGAERKELFALWRLTWPEDAQDEWRSNPTVIPRHPWLWLYFKASMRWRDALVNLGVPRKLFFDSTRHWSSEYAEWVEWRRAKDISTKSVGNTKGRARLIVLPEADVRAMAASGLSVWQLHKLTGSSESTIRINLQRHGLGEGMEAVFTKTKTLSHEDFLALERIAPGFCASAQKAKEDPATFLAQGYNTWLSMCHLMHRFKKLLRVMGEQYKEARPKQFALMYSEDENCLARELLRRGVPHARQVHCKVGDTKKIADFIIADRVVVEVDDPTHRYTGVKDARQTDLFVQLGYTVKRYRSAHVRNHTSTVVDELVALVQELTNPV